MKRLFILPSICFVILLCGCADYREIDKGYLVTSIGISSQENTTSIFVEALSSSDVISKEITRVVLTETGKNLKEAYKNLQASLVKPLYLEQLGAVFLENTDITPLSEIKQLKLDVYVVKTNSAKALFEGETISGVLGYDVISLIKTQQKNTQNQLYKIQNKNQTLPTVDFLNGKMVLSWAKENDK